MIKSMTGFGKAIGEVNFKKVNVEIKSLNSKQADISVRMPSFYKEKELPLRSMISKNLTRGKIELNLYVEIQNEQKTLTIDKDLFKKYYADFKELAEELSEPISTDLTAIITKFPDVLKSEKNELDENEWVSIDLIIKEALQQLNEFRLIEGQTLADELNLRITNIENLLLEVEQFESVRIDTVKERIKANLNEIVSKDGYNAERLEQEMIFYIEKYDVTEEKTRLAAHINYFRSTMNSKISEGRKLGFIGQEIGREINTLGSKANNADLQKIVVQMKDELEKIKEQILNIL
jgi:uncharacterized protein (TIGR00255 family)